MSARLAILASVVMPMMKVGVVRVLVAQGRVVMPVGMRLCGRIALPMCMLMMLIVDVAMFVVQPGVGVLMLVSLRKMQPDADRHQSSRAHEGNGNRLMEQT